MAIIGIDARMYSAHTGIGRYTAELIEHLQNSDTTNTYKVFLLPGNEAQCQLTNKNWQKVVVDAPHYSIAEQTKFAWALYNHKCDIVHFTHFNVPMLYFKKFLVTIHDLTLSIFPGQSRNSLIHRIAYESVIKKATRAAAGIIAISQHTKKDIQKFLKISEEKITTIYESNDEKYSPQIPEKIIRECKQKHGITKKYFLHTGNWRTHKNVECLIRAFNQFCHDFPNAEYELVLSGKEEGKDTVTTLIENSPYKDRIKSLGFIDLDDMYPLMAGAFTYVFPSFYEGFGLPLVEAMASATPVLAANTTSLPEICEEGALYFDPNESSELATLMGTLHYEEDTYKTLAEKGISQAKKFSWQKTAQETHEYYQKFIK